jgi:hypothetical protein
MPVPAEQYSRHEAPERKERTQSMNIVLWVFQIVLALLCLAGGAYKLFAFEELARMPATAALSRGAWGAIGVFEMVCGVLLIVPAAMKWMPTLTPLAAAALYAQHSPQLAATNPLVWVAAMALMAAFVAYGRHTLKPPA